MPSIYSITEVLLFVTLLLPTFGNWRTPFIQVSGLQIIRHLSWVSDQLYILSFTEKMDNHPPAVTKVVLIFTPLISKVIELDLSVCLSGQNLIWHVYFVLFLMGHHKNVWFMNGRGLKNSHVSFSKKCEWKGVGGLGIRPHTPFFSGPSAPQNIPFSEIVRTQVCLKTDQVAHRDYATNSIVIWSCNWTILETLLINHIYWQISVNL